MKFLILLTLGVLLGSANCDSKCFTRKFETCAENSIKDIKKVYSSCDDLRQQAKCVYAAALDCQTAFIPEAYWYVYDVDEMCGKKTKQIEARRHCFAGAVDGENCQKKYKNFLKDKKTPKEVLDGLKNVCKEVDWFKRCLVGNVEDECGGMAVEWFSAGVLSGVVELQELLCSEVLLPGDENLPELVISGLPRIMDVVSALLKVP